MHTGRFVMFVLPRKTRMTHRKIEKPLRTWVQQFSPRWDLDKLGAVMAERADQTNDLEQFVRYDLLRGTWGMMPLFNFRREYIPIEPGDALVCFANRYQMATSDITIYVDTLTNLYDIADELSVARDAFMSGDLATFRRLGRRALPNGWPIFDMLVRLEQRYIAKALL